MHKKQDHYEKGTVNILYVVVLWKESTGPVTLKNVLKIKGSFPSGQSGNGHSWQWEEYMEMQALQCDFV